MAEERNDSAPTDVSRRDFLKIGAGTAAAGAVVLSAIEIPLLGASSSTKSQHVKALQTQVGALEQQVSQNPALQDAVDRMTTQVATVSGFLYLSAQEQSLLGAVSETVVPTDGNGPGAEEAGIVYFIDRQLASDYGSSGSMFMDGPFVGPGLQAPLTIGGSVYPHGTPVVGLTSGMRYQYPLELRRFWRLGLDALQAYANRAFGANYEALPSDKQAQVLTDLWNNVPTAFNGLTPVDFAYELFLMVWAGFFMDPLYGGNRGMVGWAYTGFNGTNQGDFYGEGKTPLALALAGTPTRLRPASLAQFQRQEPIL